MSGCLYVLTGASGCGKTTLLNRLCPSEVGAVDPLLRTAKCPKYSERERRPEKDGVVDDITHVDRIDLKDFDIAYVINNTKYGIRLCDIERLLNEGTNPIVILSDLRVIRRLKDAFGNRARALYISSSIDADRVRRLQLERYGFQPTAEERSVLSYHFERIAAAARLGWWDRVSGSIANLEVDWRAYAPDARSTDIRVQRIRAFHIRYIEQLHFFDHVILNYSEGKPDEMVQQARNIITDSSDLSERMSERVYPPIFVVAAASGSGKGTLMEMLNLMGRDRIAITSKLAKRDFRPEDKRDGMIALRRRAGDPPPEWPTWWTPAMIESAKQGQFPTEYDISWEFHKGSEGDIATHYAVSSHEIQGNLDKGVPQIFVSNIQMFSQFRDRWPRNVVFLYLHRLSSDHDDREYQMRKWADAPRTAEVRIAEKRKVHQDYIDRIAEFDHVLLNTWFEEDLYDQMFNLIEHYETKRASEREFDANTR
jgi:guanylate kinase